MGCAPDRRCVVSGLQGHTPGPLADVLRMLAGNVDNGTWNSADVPGFVGYCASRMTEAAAALAAKDARIAELEAQCADTERMRIEACDHADVLTRRIAKLEGEALARSNAIRQAYATVRCAIERGERTGATADDVLRVLVTLDIPAALECVRDGSFVR